MHEKTAGIVSDKWLMQKNYLLWEAGYHEV